MPTVQHPAFPEITYEITEEQVDEHLEQGWVLVPAPDPVQSSEPFNNGELAGGLNTITNGTGEPENVGTRRRRK